MKPATAPGSSGTSLQPFRNFPALALCSILVLAPLPFGSTHGWSVSVFEWAAFSSVALLLSLEGAERVFAKTRPVLVALVPLFAVLVLQMTALPHALLEVASPSTAKIYAEMLGPSAQWRTLSLDPHRTLLGTIRVLAYGAVFLLAATAPEPHGRCRILNAIITAGTLAAIVAWLHYFFGWQGELFGAFAPNETVPAAGQPLRWPFVDHDHLAAFMNLSMPLALAGLLYPALLGGMPDASSARTRRMLLAGVLGLEVVTVLAAKSFVGLLSGAAGLVLLAMLWPRTVRGSRVLRNTALATITAVALFLVWVLWNHLGFDFSKPIEPDLPQRERNVRVRIEVPLQTLEIAKAFPLFGTGAGTWEEIYPRYQRYPLLWQGHFTHAHADYAEWGSDLGISGIASVLLLVVVYARMVARRLDGSAAVRRAALLAAAASIAVNSAFDFPLRIPANAIAASAMLGLACRETMGTAPQPVRASSFAWTDAFAAAAVFFLVLRLGALEWRDDWVLWVAKAGQPPGASAEVDWQVLDQVAWRSLLARKPTPDLALRAVAAAPVAADAHWTLSFSLASARAAELEMRRAIACTPHYGWIRMEHARRLLQAGLFREAAQEVETAYYVDPRTGIDPILEYVAPSGERPLREAALRGLRRRAQEYPLERQPLITIERLS